MTNFSKNSTPYDDDFFDYINRGAISSAHVVTDHLLKELEISSVLDVGCGQGAWLSVWKKNGVENVFGLDGHYVDRKKLMVDEANFLAHDLSEDLALNKQFSLVQSLEVAEHISENHAKTFVNNLVKHSDFILFSAAPPGQGGDNHINEQPYEYWRKLFSEHSYDVIDWVRPKLKNNPNVERWYQYNTFLYVKSSKVEHLTLELKKYLLPSSEELKDISPAWYRLRKLTIRLLPLRVKNKLARLKEQLTIATRRKI